MELSTISQLHQLPQKNGAVERKIRTLQEMARTMIVEGNLPKYFWAEAVNTSSYIFNRALVRSLLKKTPYELWKGKEHSSGHFRVFGCKCFILNDKEQLGKLDRKSDEAIFLGCSEVSKDIEFLIRGVKLLKNQYM